MKGTIESDVTILTELIFELVETKNWKQKLPQTNAQSNAGMPIRWNIRITYIHLCWLALSNNLIPLYH